MSYVYIRNTIVINFVYEVYTPLLKNCVLLGSSEHATDVAETKEENAIVI